MNLSRFNEIYDQYYLMVMKVAYNVLRDYHYAQDICQEVFVLLYLKRDILDEEYIKPWLLVNAKRKAIDLQRKKYYGREFCEEGISLERGTGENIENDYVRKEFQSTILEALQKKDRQWYEIFFRVTVEGESQKSVAEDLGISLSNLRIKLHRAKVWMRNMFLDEYKS